MNVAKHTLVCLASAALLTVGLLVLLSAASPTASADPGDLFASPTGSGNACSQASPCDLQMALS